MSAALRIVLGAAVPVLVALAVAGFVRRRRRVAVHLGDPSLVAALVGEDLVAVPWRRVVPVLLAALLLGTALTDPRWGAAAEAASVRGGRVVLVLDASGSMLAGDLAPTRLEALRAASRELAAGLPEAAMAVVVFAGRAYALVPPTTDRGALDLFLDALDPAMVTQSGSSLSAALRQGLGLLAAGDAGTGGGALVLVSDGDAGEDPARVLEAAALARRAGVPVYVLGAGTPAGAPVPEIDFATGRAVGFLRGDDGRPVVTRLNESLLREIARATGGEYAALSEPGAVGGLIERLRERVGEAGSPADRRPPRFAGFAALALLLLAAETAAGGLAPRRRP